MVTPGRFITLEGMEGVGKSSNLASAAQWLERHGVDVLVTREPGGTPLAEAVRELLLAVREEPVAPLTELLLMFAARAQHLATVIEPALAGGRWVLCDRFTDATYAYQGGGRQLEVKVIAELEQLVHPLRQPDLTLFLDLEWAVAKERIESRELDRFEQEAADFFGRVRAVYLDRARSFERYVTIDAGQSLPQVGAAVAAVLEQRTARWLPTTGEPIK
ncbi:MAG: dTMP kinase [Pseudomonadales bacterium]